MEGVERDVGPEEAEDEHDEPLAPPDAGHAAGAGVEHAVNVHGVDEQV